MRGLPQLSRQLQHSCSMSMSPDSSTSGEESSLFDSTNLIFEAVKTHLVNDTELRVLTSPYELRRQILAILSSLSTSTSAKPISFIEFFDSQAWRQLSSSRVTSDIFLNDLRVLLLHVIGKYNSLSAEKVLTLLLELLNERSTDTLSLHAAFPKQPATRMQDFVCQALNIDPFDNEELKRRLTSLSSRELVSLLEGWKMKMVVYVEKLKNYLESTEVSEQQRSWLEKNASATLKLVTQIDEKIVAKSKLAAKEEMQDFIAAMQMQNDQSSGQNGDSSEQYKQLYEDTPVAVRSRLVAVFRASLDKPK